MTMVILKDYVINNFRNFLVAFLFALFKFFYHTDHFINIKNKLFFNLKFKFKST